MPTNKVSNQRGKTGGRQDSSTKERWPESMTDTQSEGYGLSEMAEQASDYVSHGASRLREGMSQCTREHEGTALMVSLAAGFGVGLVLGCAIMSSVSSHRRPTSWRDRLTAEGIGRKIMDQIETMIPETLSQRFGN
jgi:hypothetical protein